jgi:hypothetical protein
VIEDSEDSVDRDEAAPARKRRNVVSLHLRYLFDTLLIYLKIPSTIVLTEYQWRSILRRLSKVEDAANDFAQIKDELARVTTQLTQVKEEFAQVKESVGLDFTGKTNQTSAC